jgi:hypothetical protein
MLRHTHPRRLLTTLATGAALAATATSASAMPVDNGGPSAATRVRVVRVQVDEGLDWGDAGIGAAGMLALVLVGFGGVRTATFLPARQRSTAHS